MFNNVSDLEVVIVVYRLIRLFYEYFLTSHKTLIKLSINEI